MYETINCRGRLLDFVTPKVMGILNVTPDSFYDGGQYTLSEAIQKRVGQLIDEKVDIIDVGGMSSRPGSAPVSWQEEWERVRSGLEILHGVNHDIPLSIDTIHTEVLERSIDYGVSIVNDISGGTHSPEMISLAARHKMPYIVMHMQGRPDTMQDNPTYDDVVLEVISYLNKQERDLRSRGVVDVIVDPGFGFGKTIKDNYQLLDKLHTLRLIEAPILVGLSRKSMIYKTLDIAPQQALNGTTALHMKALMEGASILRVHDVKEAVECVQLFAQLKNAAL